MLHNKQSSNDLRILPLTAPAPLSGVGADRYSDPKGGKDVWASPIRLLRLKRI